MKAWLRKNHVLMKLLSVLLSLLLWLYVIYQDNPERTVTYSDLSVRLLNTEYLKRYNGLVVTNADRIRVSVKLSGTFNRLENIAEDDIRVTADVSKLTEAGTYTLSYDISALDDVRVVQRSPAIQITVEALETVELPVNISISGNLPEGMITDSMTSEPKTVTVTGLHDSLESANCVQVTVDAAELAQDYEADCSFELLDKSGKLLDVSGIDFDRKRVHVNIPVSRVKKVPIEVDTVYGKGATEENTVVSLSRDSVTVIGKAEAVEALDSIHLTTIDTTAFIQESHQDYPIRLPEGVRTLDGVESVRVDVSFTDLETRQILIDDIRLENPLPNFDSVPDTRHILVSVRGSEEMLDSLAEGDISVVADLSEIAVSEGMQNIPAQIVLSERVSDLGIFGNYSVVIRSTAVSEEQQPQGQTQQQTIPQKK